MSWKWSSIFGVLIVLWALFGCAYNGRHGFVASSSSRKGIPSFQEAGEASYRFAVTGQVLDEVSQTPINNFSVSPLAPEAALNSVLNGLGDKNGIFHLSRSASIRDALFTQIPILISAPGFEPFIQNLELGSDCKIEPCLESRPIHLMLHPVPSSNGTLSPAGVSLAAVTRLLEDHGIPTLFKAMTSQGKADSTIVSELATARNRDMISNVLVILKPGSTKDSPDLVAQLLGSVSSAALKNLTGVNAGMASSLVPLIANTNPKLSSQLLSVSQALSYLTPILGAVADKESGPLGQVVAGLLNGTQNEKTWFGLAQAIQAQSKQPSLAMPLLSLLPGVSQAVTPATTFPFSDALGTSLKNPSLLNFIGAMGRNRTGVSTEQRLLVDYGQSLLQGLVSKNAPEIALLFNTLVQQDGLMALKEFTSLPNKDKFTKLIPYIEPLIRGLNSQDSPHLAAALLPFLEQKNPALALRELVTKGSGDLSQKGQVVASLFPALPQVLSQSVPAKQVFSAQLLSGLVNGDLNDVQVVQDLAGTSGLILSGQARDLFKIAQLPNVERLLALPAAK